MIMVRKAAVLGAGLMGTAVAAQLANAGIPTLPRVHPDLRQPG
jgi:3-hydroxyacyl-CoA dehydrogenase